MLKGKAKVDYQRDYMRKRRANKTIRPQKVRPDLKSLDLLDHTLDDCRSGLANVNKNIEEVMETMKKKEKPKAFLIPQTIPGKTLEETADVYREIIDNADNKSTHVCPACGGLGYRELDRAGLIRLPCEECRK